MIQSCNRQFSPTHPLIARLSNSTSALGRQTIWRLWGCKKKISGYAIDNVHHVSSLNMDYIRTGHCDDDEESRWSARSRPAPIPSPARKSLFQVLFFFDWPCNLFSSRNTIFIWNRAQSMTLMTPGPCKVGDVYFKFIKTPWLAFSVGKITLNATTADWICFTATTMTSK